LVAALPLLDCFVLQMCEMHDLLRSPTAASDAALLPFEDLTAASHAVDALGLDAARPMSTALAAAISGNERDPRAVLHALGQPLLQAFLPFAAAHLASLLHALLTAGPEQYDEPVLELAAMALRQPDPQHIVPSFKPLIRLALNAPESAGAVELLAAAMQASRIVDDPLSARLVAEPQRLARAEAPIAEYANAKDIAMPALGQVLESFA